MMNREILSKAISIETGEWVEGDMVHIGKNKEPFIVTGNPSYQVLFDDDDNSEHASIPLSSFIQVDPSTVCQFTGLLDARNNRIFEGDILSHDYVVVYDAPSFKTHLELFPEHANNISPEMARMHTIKGNIHTPKEQDNE